MENESREQNVLVISDSEADRATICLQLRRKYRFQLADNESQALKLLEKTNKRISCIVLDVSKGSVESWSFLRRMQNEDDTMQYPPVLAISGNTDDSMQKLALCSGAWGFIGKRQDEKVLLAYIQNAVQYWESRLSREERRLSDVDRVSGIWNKEHFFRQIRRTLDGDPDGKYCLIRFDLNRFKVFNEMFGVREADKLLRFIGVQLEQRHPNGSHYAHIVADHFALFVRRRVNVKPEEHFEMLRKLVAAYPIKYDLTISAGVYEVEDPTADPGLMCDCAMLALRTTKGSGTKTIGWYDQELRNKLQYEQKLVEELRRGMQNREFEVYYQPQFNAETGDVIGAEALVRWNHPQRGLLAPGEFIPVMVRNGLITQLDEYVWVQCCQQISAWRESGIDFKKRELPISLNISLMDVYRTDLCQTLCELTARYDIPRTMLRLEITESAYMDNPAQFLTTATALHREGFVLVMDDFGSGYSSINTLKDVPMDGLKLDMRFMADKETSSRSGSILGSVIRMARRLQLPVIAEGVERKEQADFLKNIGCIYMQGYYFSQPIPASRLEALLRLRKLSVMSHFIQTEKAENEQLWSEDVRSALIFNALVGGAAILEYDGKTVEMVSVNERFLSMVNATRGEYAPFMHGVEERFTGKFRQAFLDMLKKAIQTRQEATAELHSKPINTNRYIWTRCRAKLLNHNEGSDLLFLAVEDITKQKAALDELKKNHSFLQSVVEALPCGVLLFNMFRGKLMLRSCNNEAVTLLGYDSQETLMQELHESPLPRTLAPEDAERLRGLYKQLATGQTRRMETTCTLRLPQADKRLTLIAERKTLPGGTDLIEQVLFEDNE